MDPAHDPLPASAGGETDRQQRFRSVMGHFPSGVTVITATGAAGHGGMTANAVCSLSLDPLLLLVCFDNGSRTLPLVSESRRLGVNVLRADQDAVARAFASKAEPEEMFAGVDVDHSHGVPILRDALAWLVCELRELIPGGDHTIGIAAVGEMGHAEGDPLVWYRGAYVPFV